MEDQQVRTGHIHICVITPTHNRCGYLKEAVDSVRANVKVPMDFTYEHYICENGCTDDTNKYLIEASKESGAPVCFWSEPEKLLPGPARNVIIKHAPDDAWLAPLDDDDIMLQRNLYYYAELIHKNPKLTWIINDFLRMDHERRYEPKQDYYAGRFDSPKQMLNAIFRNECFIQGNVCMSKKLFDEVGGYHEALRMAEDLDLYIRFLLAGHLPVFSPHLGHLHRNHPNNISIGVDREKHFRDVETIYERYEEQLTKLGVDRPSWDNGNWH